MLTSQQRNYLHSAVRPMQIIVGALAGGVAMFFVMILIMRGLPGGESPDIPFISYVAIAAAVAALLGWAVVPRVVAGQMRQAIVDGKSMISDSILVGQPVSEEEQQIRQFAVVYQTTLLIGCAILEGAAFLSVIAFFLEGQLVVVIAASVLTLLLLSQCPTTSRLESWVEDELAAIDRLRSLRRM